MTTSVFKRSNCRLCDHSDPAKVVELAPVPLAEKYTRADEEVDSNVYPIDLYMCRECGHVQLLDVIDSDTLWDDYTYHSGQTQGIIDHFKEISASIVKRFSPKPDTLVIDVGSNDGSLLRPFKERGHRVLGIDPAKEIARKATESGIETIAELFTLTIAENIRESHGPASVVTAFNVFAHADNMGEIASGIEHLLTDDGIFVFEVQYLMDIIDRMLLGTIFHEHMSHHSLLPMARFLDAHGMEMIDLERNNIQHGSVVGVAQKKGGPRPAKPIVDEMLQEENARKLDKPEALEPFVSRLDDMKSRFQSLIKEWRENGASVAGYGAARSGPTLVAQFGIRDSIEYLLDDHPQKVGLFSPGDHHEVCPTSELLDRMPDYVIILAWIHGKNIIRNNLEYLKKGGKFVLCYPEVKVVDFEGAANI
ncbi:MAG: class I SAM-dependent methyltransferase [Pseudomonadota bacterium]